MAEGFKAFEGILRGQDVTVHTDHLNLLYTSTPSQRMVRWRFMLEECNPKAAHVAGEHNDAADALSRLDMDDNSSDERDWEDSNPPLTYTDLCQEKLNLIYSLEAEEKEPEPDKGFPLAPDLIKYWQKKDKDLLARSKLKSSFTTKEMEGVELICHHGKIWVPIGMRQRVMEWYHEMLVHPGQSRMEKTIRLAYTWKGL